MIIFKSILALLAIFWIIVAQVISTLVPMDDVASFFDSVGIDTGFFLSEEPSEYVPETETVDNFFTTVFFQVFLVTSTVVLILGTLILSRKRTFYEALFLFLAFIIPKRRKYWGTVFDDTSKKPIPFSLVRVIKAFEEEKKDVFVTETITDLDGKYRIILEKNEPGLNLWANATGFVPYTKDILFTGDRELEIVEDLPLSKQKLSGLALRNMIGVINSRLSVVLIWTFYILSFLYLLSSILYLVTWPDSLYSYVSVLVFVVSVIWNTSVILERYKPKIGRVIDKDSKQPIEGALLKIYDKQRQLITIMTNSKGFAKVNLPYGEYLVSIHKQGYESTSGSEFIEIYVREDGHWDEDLLMKRQKGIAPSAPVEEGAKLMNPFG